MSKLFIVTPIGCYQEKPQVECITDDFEKWLQDNNERRLEDGEEPELEEEFNVEEVESVIYYKIEVISPNISRFRSGE